MKSLQEQTTEYFSNLSGRVFQNQKGIVQQEKQQDEVSVVILTYYPSWNKLMATVQSALKQRNVNLQIVISDDGSKDSFFSELEQYFQSVDFSNYCLTSSDINQGTVKNALRGLGYATGKYVKIISPGDYLVDEHILKDWLDDIQKHDIKWSFSDAIYYSKTKEGVFNLVSTNAHPMDIRPYRMKDWERCRWNYCVLDDIALGAAILCERQLLIQYLERIVEKVIYAEDNVFRMMMFDGIVGNYYPVNTILYEHGLGGISTSGNSIWKERLQADWEATNEEMLQKADLSDQFQNEVLKIYKSGRKNSKLRSLLIKGRLEMKIYRMLVGRKTSIDISE